jgi:glutamate dehydrogenase
MNVLESYPRDELFQIDVPTLTDNVQAIVALAERPRVRVLSRIDPFDRFVSVIVFVPRDRYDSEVRARHRRISRRPATRATFRPITRPSRKALARVHFIIGRREGKTPTPKQAKLEADIEAITRTWEDHFLERTDGRRHQPGGARAARRRFSRNLSRHGAAGPGRAGPAAHRPAVGGKSPIDVDFFRPTGKSHKEAGLRIYHYGSPVALSERVPLLENMGFRVISELTYAIDVADKLGNIVWLHEMQIESQSGKEVPMDDDGVIFEDAFMSVWNRESDNDPYNGLVLAAGLTCRQVTVLRAYGRYLRQAGTPYGQGYIADALIRHPLLARQLYDLFETLFDPARRTTKKEDTEVTAKHIRAAIADQLADVPSIDDDRILRSILTVIDATLRTNYFSPRSGRRACVPRSPSSSIRAPSPTFPIPSPSAKSSSSGRRWKACICASARSRAADCAGPTGRRTTAPRCSASSRRSRSRTPSSCRSAPRAASIPNACPPAAAATRSSRPAAPPTSPSYRRFCRSPTIWRATRSCRRSSTVRRDGDDPYFVVAADKGTATFSDTANAISQEMGFWLDDAFASGGSAGYDHKKMGITARGAWEAVKRHFREMDKDIQSEPFTVVGVGDMSGDVFGNGMLLSEKIRLIAAFDHRDIFIDPDPDPKTSFAERKRMFGLGRSELAGLRHQETVEGRRHLPALAEDRSRSRNRPPTRSGSTRPRPRRTRS